MARKHYGKRRNCSFRAISPFPTVFSKDLNLRHVKTRACLEKGSSYMVFFFQAILIMDIAIQRYGSYEKFEEQTGGKILQRSNIVALIQRYLKRENMEREIMVNLSEDLLSRGSMTRIKGKPTLNVRVVNLREYWVEGLLRHEIGKYRFLHPQNS